MSDAPETKVPVVDEAPATDDDAPKSLPAAAVDDDADLVHRLTRLLGLRLLVLTVFLAAVSFVYVGNWSTGGVSAFIAFLTAASGFFVSGVCAILLRYRKLLRHVGFGQLVVDQVFWTAIVFVTGGITSGAVSLYGLTCIIGAVLFARAGAIAAFAAASVSYVTLSVSLIYGLVRQPPDQSVTYVTRWSEAAYPLFANLFAIGLVAALGSYLAERLRATGGDLARAEARAEQAEKLALLGTLAAGLAHEIRNPLGSIAGSIELLGESPDLTEDERMLCNIVRRETDRLNELVGDMLQLSRARTPELAPLDVAALAREVAGLAGQSGRGAEVVVRYDGEDALVIEADEAQLRQVLWNLVRNAIQVSSAGQEVVVVVRHKGAGVELAVRDSGTGIPESARDRIFDAFFTTRSHGTGLGLAVVKRILDDHGFAIVADSSSEGTSFRVSIPPPRRALALKPG